MAGWSYPRLVFMVLELARKAPDYDEVVESEVYRTTISELLDAGLVELSGFRGPRRRIRLQLTEAGVARLAEAREAAVAVASAPA